MLHCSVFSHYLLSCTCNKNNIFNWNNTFNNIIINRNVFICAPEISTFTRKGRDSTKNLVLKNSRFCLARMRCSHPLSAYLFHIHICHSLVTISMNVIHIYLWAFSCYLAANDILLCNVLVKINSWGWHLHTLKLNSHLHANICLQVVATNTITSIPLNSNKKQISTTLEYSCS